MENVISAGRKALRLGMSAVLAATLVPLPAFAGEHLDDASTELDGNSGDAPTYTASEAECVPGEILVQYDDAGEPRFGGLSLSLMEEQLSESADVEVTETVAERDANHGTVVKAEIADAADPFEAAERAAEVPGVTHAQPNFVYHLLENAPAATDLAAVELGELANDDPTQPTDDTFIAQQYSLGSWEDSHGANVIEAWKSVKADATAEENNEPPVTVAILDTGIYANHLDLKDQIWEDYMWDAYHGGEPGKENFLDSGSNPTGDIVGHGTHVAGIAAATANNGQGIAGASYNAKLLPIKVFNDSSYNAYAQTEWLYKAYQYLMSDADGNGETVADETNTHVVNMSLGGYGYEGEIDDLFESAIKTAADDYNIITICAGGNGDDYGNPYTIPTYPGDYEECVSVTCLSTAGTNTYWSDYNKFKDVSAPGVDILSSYNDTENSYTKMTGTSMASPLVAGIAALLFTADPALSVEDAKEALCTNVNPLDPKGQNYRAPITDDNPNGVTGSLGCIDAAAAVEAVLQTSGTTRVGIQECALDAISDQLYTGEAVEPEIAITYDDGEGAEPLEKDVDYRVLFKDNVKVGEATATIVGQGAYIGRRTLNFNIKYDFSKATVMPDKESYAATGSAVKPPVHVALGGRLLRQDADYTVSYSDNIAVGTGKIAVEGSGDYLGTVNETFELTFGSSTPGTAQAKRDLSKVGVAAVKDQTYKKAGVTPSPKLTDWNGKALAPDVDYKLGYKNNKKAGYAQVVATAKGDAWKGSTNAYFRILTAAPTLSDVKSSTKYAADAKMAVRLGLMTAKSKKFNVGGNFTRGEAAVLLHTLAGKPKSSKTTRMNDVKSSASNYKALQWACANGMLATSSNKVQPTKAITQQDLANMLYRFGVIVSHGDMTVGVSKFFSAADRTKVSATDRVGVAWAAEKGALALTAKGGKKYLNPTTAVKRNVAAHMLVAALDVIYAPGKATKASNDTLSTAASSPASLAARAVEAASDAAVFALMADLAPHDEPGEALDADNTATSQVTGQAVALEAEQGDFTYTCAADGGLHVTGYSGKGYTVEIPSKVTGLKLDDEIVKGDVTGIDADAFSNMRSLRVVSIPSSVRSIGSRAFYGCSNLIKATIPEGVESIGSEAFWGCSSLEELNLPASLAQLGRQPFTNQKLKRIGVAAGSETFASVGGVLFSKDKKTLVCYPMGRAMGSYTVPDGTVAIGDSAFCGVPSASSKPLTEVVLPDGLESIGAHAFQDADGVLGIAVPESVTSIGEYAFANMDVLKRLVPPSGIAEIPDGFARSSLKLVEFQLPGSVTVVGNDAFRDTNIWGISLPEGLVSIGARAFSGCKKMEGLSLPSTLRSMGQYAFQNCTSITQVNLADSGLSALAKGVFSGATALTSVEVPASITRLDEECFWGCTSLSEVTFADSASAPCQLAEIPANAFSNDPIESLVIPSSITAIGSSAFAGNGALASLVVQNQGTWSKAPDAFGTAEPEAVYGYRGSSTWRNFSSSVLKSIDVANDLPLDGAYRVVPDKTVRLRTMVVSDNGFVSLQWRKDGVDVTGATGGVLEVPASDAGTYTLVATSDLDPTHPVEFSTRVVQVPALPLAISGAAIQVADASYTGKAVEPEVEVTYDGDVLERGVDYTLSYSNNVKLGSATGVAKIVGKGEFSGTATKKFSIVARATYSDAGSGWYSTPVKEAAARGLMAGASAAKFGPTANATRGQVAAVLYGLANRGSSVSESMALNWTVSKKIFAKKGSASAAITHQDLALALFAFAKVGGVKTTGASAAAFLGLSDFNSISSSARTACIFTSASGILGAAGDGKAKKFLPTAKTTRAELARAAVALDNLM